MNMRGNVCVQLKRGRGSTCGLWKGTRRWVDGLLYEAFMPRRVGWALSRTPIASGPDDELKTLRYPGHCEKFNFS